MKKGVAIQVNTPHGRKHHGDVRGTTFIRTVSWERDRMRMFNAWSIHPEALDTLKRMSVGELIYRCDGRIYRITMANVDKYSFKKEFSGGETVYIPLEHWTLDGASQTKLPLAFVPKVEKQKDSQSLF